MRRSSSPASAHHEREWRSAPTGTATTTRHHRRYAVLVPVPVHHIRGARHGRGRGEHPVALDIDAGRTSFIGTTSSRRPTSSAVSSRSTSVTPRAVRVRPGHGHLGRDAAHRPPGDKRRLPRRLRFRSQPVSRRCRSTSRPIPIHAQRLIACRRARLVRLRPQSSGVRWWYGRAASIAAATSRSSRSAPGRPTSWRPAGRPSWNSAGIEIAGTGAVITQHDIIQPR